MPSKVLRYFQVSKKSDKDTIFVKKSKFLTVIGTERVLFCIRVNPSGVKLNLPVYKQPFMSTVDLQRRRKREIKSTLFSTISKPLWPLALLLFHNLREISAQKLFVRDIFKLKSILEDYHYYYFFLFSR